MAKGAFANVKADLKAAEQPPAPVTTKANGQGDRQASREGLSTIIFYDTPEANEELKVLAARKRRTMQGLLREALDDLFSKYKIVPVVRTEKNPV